MQLRARRQDVGLRTTYINMTTLSIGSCSTVSRHNTCSTSVALISPPHSEFKTFNTLMLCFTIKLQRHKKGVGMRYKRQHRPYRTTRPGSVRVCTWAGNGTPPPTSKTSHIPRSSPTPQPNSSTINRRTPSVHGIITMKHQRVNDMKVTVAPIISTPAKNSRGET